MTARGSPTQPILPGATIGVFGSGQLGRMFALAARRLGYRIHTFSPHRDSPTGQVADKEWCAAYDDGHAVREFVRGVDVVTFEFENVPSSVAEIADEAGVPIRPGGSVLHTAQNRLREKRFLASAGLPVAPFAPVATLEELDQALIRIGLPAILKTTAFGYDGKGQARIDAASDAETAWHEVGAQPAILEAFVPFTTEISVVAAHGVDGSFANFGAIENSHRHHILDLSIAPARVPLAVAARAADLAQIVMEELQVIGVLCVEYFVTGNNELLINEIAPRPHNSGHLTIDAAITSQFEQQVRAVCALPLGCTDYLRAAVMVNLLGDLWASGIPDWPSVLAEPGVKLHLYGKAEPRPGRKMGHITILADAADEALQIAANVRRKLESGIR